MNSKKCGQQQTVTKLHVLSYNVWRTEENTKRNQVWVVCVSAEIRTQQLANTSQKGNNLNQVVQYMTTTVLLLLLLLLCSCRTSGLGTQRRTEIRFPAEMGTRVVVSAFE
jgi:hypothetical protein